MRTALPKNIVIKGLTRDGMFWGVPLNYMMLNLAVSTMLAFFVYPHLLFIVFGSVWLMLKILIEYDENILRTLDLKLKFITSPKSRVFYGAKTYIANDYRIKDPNSGSPELSIIGLDKIPSLQEVLPYSTLLSDSIVLTKDYRLLTTWKIEGINYQTEDDEILYSRSQLLNMLYKQVVAHKEFTYYIHSAKFPSQDIHLKAHYENEFLNEFFDMYHQRLKDVLYTNELYLTLVYTPLASQVDLKVFKKLKPAILKEQIGYFTDDLEDHANRVEAILKLFSPNRLRTYTNKKTVYSKQLEFYNYIIGNRWQPIKVLHSPVHYYLTGGLQNIQIGKNVAQLNYPDMEEGLQHKKKFCQIVEIKELSNETQTGIMNILNESSGLNYLITQSFTPKPKNLSKDELEKKISEFISANDRAVSQHEELEYGLDKLISGEISFGNYHYTIAIYADSIDKVTNDTNHVISQLAGIGLTITVSDMALTSSYLSQIPGNLAERTRITSLTSENFSDYNPFHSVLKGKMTQNTWGDAIAILRTTTNEPYFFNLHSARADQNDFNKPNLGNTFGIGKSRGGKTVFLLFLMMMIQKFGEKSTFPPKTAEKKKKLITFYLDKDYGAMGGILAAGGTYLSLKSGEPTGFNPFMLEATSTNIQKLQVLIKMLVTRNGEKLYPTEEEQIDRAVNFIMKEFSKEERSYPITRLYEDLTEDINDTNSVKKRLKIWTKGERFGWVFDNEKDTLDFNDDTANIFGIDGTEYLDDDDVSDPISYYIFWRIFEYVDGRRFVLFMDELWQQIKNRIVREKYKDFLKTIAKQNGLVVGFTQSIEDITQSDIAKPIIEQSATMLFFANEKADKEEYKKLTCTEKEFEVIRNFKPSEYKFMIKREEGSTVATINLEGIPREYIKILSTEKADVEKIEDIFSQEGLSHSQKVEKLKDLYR
jgi:type IV secretion system protein VirB4